MNPITFVQIGTLASIVVGAVGLLVGIVIYWRQTNAQVFLEYTLRYAQVMDSFPPDARNARFDLQGTPPESNEPLTLAVLRYLNLCSEEFYLWEKHYLSGDIWRIWEAELNRTLRSPLILREWETLKREFDSYPEFLGYVENAQKDSR